MLLWTEQIPPKIIKILELFNSKKRLRNYLMEKVAGAGLVTIFAH